MDAQTDHALGVLADRVRTLADQTSEAGEIRPRRDIRVFERGDLRDRKALDVPSDLKRETREERRSRGIAPVVQHRSAYLVLIVVTEVGLCDQLFVGKPIGK